LGSAPWLPARARSRRPRWLTPPRSRREIGQDDIKLDGAFVLVGMTRDFRRE
jgi:hypothetical protein